MSIKNVEQLLASVTSAYVASANLASRDTVEQLITENNELRRAAAMISLQNKMLRDRLSAHNNRGKLD